VQREFVGGVVAEAGYIGNLSRKLSVADVNINQIRPELLEVIRPAGVFRQAYRPFPQFNAVTLSQPSFGVTDYHAGVVKIEKRFSHGLSLLGTYTWSKNLGNIDSSAGDIGADQQYSNYYNRRADKGPAGLDLHHRFTWSSVYELPFGRVVARPSGRVNHWLGGWTLGAIASLQSAGPFTVTTQTNTTNVSSSGAQRANVLRDANLPNSAKSLVRWFDTSAFEAPASFAFGNADGRINFDFSMGKSFRFAESASAQFRAETFNAFNHPDFGLPGTVLGAAGFGVMSSATDARVLQFGLRIVF
jgi:hypothetical protein